MKSIDFQGRWNSGFGLQSINNHHRWLMPRPLCTLFSVPTGRFIPARHTVPGSHDRRKSLRPERTLHAGDAFCFQGGMSQSLSRILLHLVFSNVICRIDFTLHEASLQDAMNSRGNDPGTVCRAGMNRPVGTENKTRV